MTVHYMKPLGNPFVFNTSTTGIFWEPTKNQDYQVTIPLRLCRDRHTMLCHNNQPGLYGLATKFLA